MHRLKSADPVESSLQIPRQPERQLYSTLSGLAHAVQNCFRNSGGSRLDGCGHRVYG